MGTDRPDTDVGEPGAQNLKLVRLHYAAYASGDFDGLVEGLDPQVVITIHDDHGKPEGMPVHGRNGARDFFGSIDEDVSDHYVEIDHLRADEDKVLARVRLGGVRRRTGERGEIQAVHLFALHEGLICEISTYRPDWRG